MKVRKVYPGHRYGKLIAIEIAGWAGQYVCWKCACDCGRRTIVRAPELLGGTTTTCLKCRHEKVSA